MLFCVIYMFTLHFGLSFLCIIGELGTYTVVWTMDGRKAKWVQINLLLKVLYINTLTFAPKQLISPDESGKYFLWCLARSFLLLFKYYGLFRMSQIHSKIIVPWKREDGNKAYSTSDFFFLWNYWLQFLVQRERSIIEGDTGVDFQTSVPSQSHEKTSNPIPIP